MKKLMSLQRSSRLMKNLINELMKCNTNNCYFIDSVFQSKRQLKKHMKKKHLIKISEKTFLIVTLSSTWKLIRVLKHLNVSNVRNLLLLNGDWESMWLDMMVNHFVIISITKKKCPYEELGCMFQHADSAICKEMRKEFMVI